MLRRRGALVIFRDTVDSDDFVAKTDSAAVDHAGGYAAMPANRVVAAAAQYFLHAGARVARAGAEQDGRSEAEMLPAKRQEVDSGNNDISAQVFWVDPIRAEIGRNGSQMFSLDQRDLPKLTGATTGATLVMVSVQAMRGIEGGFCHHLHGLSAFRAQPDPCDHARSHGGLQQK